MLRRGLLGLTVALLVAQTLAPGEDPGLLGNQSGVMGLILLLLWLLAAFGVAFWRLWSRRGDFRAGVVEAALFVAVVLVFVAAESAAYKHPARLIAWHWLVLFAAFLMVRHLATSPSDQHALFGVFLANAAALAVHGVYQVVTGAAATATFARPEPLAVWLALFLPGLIAVVVVCRRAGAPRWTTILAVVFAVVGVAALGAAVVGTFGQVDVPPRTECWGTTWRMILDRPWLGVGAGNFADAYPRFMEPSAGAAVADPHNFLLELWANYGVFTVLAVLVALGAFFYLAVRWLRNRVPGEAGDSPPSEQPPIRWEFYLGGMIGLVLGFAARAATEDRPGQEILMEGVDSCVRCLVWFAAFALFERVLLSERVRVLALTAGIGASLVALTVLSGIGLFSVTVPLWAAVALALNGLPQHAWTRLNRLALLRILPVPVTAAVIAVFFLLVLNPVVSRAADVNEARIKGAAYLKTLETKDRRILDPHGSDVLQSQVIAPLLNGARDDPDDARTYVEIARWYGEVWEIDSRKKELADNAVGYAAKAEEVHTAGRAGYEAEHQLRIDFARRTEPSAPGGAVGLGYRAFLLEARMPAPEKREPPQDLKLRAAYQFQLDQYETRKGEYRQAGEALAKYARHDPNDARLRYRIAEAYYRAEEPLWRDEAERAVRLDEAATSPSRRLTDAQREKLASWLR